jgi:hypothetical protein
MILEVDVQPLATGCSCLVCGQGNELSTDTEMLVTAVHGDIKDERMARAGPHLVGDLQPQPSIGKT